MIELPTELMLHSTQGTIISGLCYVKIFIQVAHLNCDSLSIHQYISSVNTTPGVVLVVAPLPVVPDACYFQLPDPNMDHNPSSQQFP